MAITLSDDARKQSIASIIRYCADDLEFDISEIQAVSLLGFFLKQVAPTVYNAGVADAQAFLRDRLADLEATCYEPEFAYWPKGASVRRK